VDFLPHTLGERIDQAMELGAKAMKQTLESAGS